MYSCEGSCRISTKGKIMKNNKVYWTTKDGRSLDVDEIEINHLRNLVKYLIIKNEELQAQIDDYDYGDSFSIY